jgi:poly(A) polymerase
MIKKFINRLLGKADKPAADSRRPCRRFRWAARRDPADEHRIDPKLLDDNAVRVVRTLKDAGHEAYIVGGAVRDLLVGLRPEGLRRRHRRHAGAGQGAVPPRLHHRPPLPPGARGVRPRPRARGHRGLDLPCLPRQRRGRAGAATRRPPRARLPTRHTWSTPPAACCATTSGARRSRTRRGATSPSTRCTTTRTQTVVDYHGGLADARARVLRMIGDPATRYREDPVRIVRVVRFRGQAGLRARAGHAKPVREMAALLANVPASRLFDEMIKLLQTGHALRSIDELRKQGLDRGVFPVLDAVLHPERPHPLREQFVDWPGRHRPPRRGRARRGAELHAGLHAVARRAGAAGWQLRHGGEPPFPALQQAIDAVFDARIGDISGRGKLAADMREIWQMQPRFERRTAQSGGCRWRRSRAFAPATTSCACAPMSARSTSNWPTGGRTTTWAATRSANHAASWRLRRVTAAPHCRPADRTYLNAVVELATDLEPAALLAALHGIEAAHGRQSDPTSNAPRTLDLDSACSTGSGTMDTQDPASCPIPRHARTGFRSCIPLLDLDRRTSCIRACGGLQAQQYAHVSGQDDRAPDLKRGLRTRGRHTGP